MKHLLSFLILCLIAFNSFSQNTKRELIAEVKNLKDSISKISTDLNYVVEEKESLKETLNRIAPIAIDEAITPAEQPDDIIIGEAGWRIELNGNKYKNDIIGQLGTVWMLDTNMQIQPQGGFTLSDYDIPERLISLDKEVVYKKFISKTTDMQGDGSPPFVKLQAGLSKDQYSKFTISIEGTSLISPNCKILQSMAKEYKHHYNLPTQKGIFLCTGMHVIKYHSSIFSKSEGNARITSPVINVGGDFFAESNEESSEYLVVRQLTRLHKPSGMNEEKIEKKLESISTLSDTTRLSNRSFKINPQEVLRFLLKREPTFDEITSFESNPELIINKLGYNLDSLTIGNQFLYNATKEKMITLPEKLGTIAE